MISRNGNENFLVAHYDWIALGVGILALAAGAAYFALSLGEDAEESAADAVAAVKRLKPSATGVKPLDMAQMKTAVRMTRSPLQMADVSPANESFLASERRVLCPNCKKAIPGSAKTCPTPNCGAVLEEQKIVVDADGDGLPDDWEKKYGLNPNSKDDADADADGDGFTNAEEYAAKTDPTDASDHPDYLQSLTIQLPLKATFMPFIFTKATKIPSGWRCEFFDASQKDDYGRTGRTMTAVIGEEIGTSGFVFKAYEQKSAKRAIKGGQGLQKTVDVSEVTVERKKDKKTLTLVLAENKKVKPISVDVQATLVYTRGKVQSFDVVTGSEISLNGTKYAIEKIAAVGTGAKVTVKDVRTGKVSCIPLEQ